MNFVKVFDILDSRFKDWEFSAFGLIFFYLGLGILLFPRVLKAIGIPYLNVRSGWQKAFPYVFMGFSILWTTTAFLATYSEHRRHRALAEENTCRVIEGQVENFVPMPFGGHTDESFSVAGVTFKYSDFTVTDAFNNTSSHGGPIDKDSYVRICYDPSGNSILRLEIRDFRGEVKDYAKGESIFPKPDGLQNDVGASPVGTLPWYGNLFVVFYALDFIAILNLYLPYLRTFFRLSTAPVSGCVIPDGLEDQKKFKLRNSLIYWDREGRAIWLRPRGFNVFQVQLTVAKLNTDELGKAILSREVRFSSGFPVVMALFFWTAYQLFSMTFPVNSNVPSAAEFVAFGALIFIIFGFVNLRILRSRMEKLVQDALSELKETSAAR